SLIDDIHSGSRSLIICFRTPPAPTRRDTLSLHDALPISSNLGRDQSNEQREWNDQLYRRLAATVNAIRDRPDDRKPPSLLLISVDRKSTRLNSSHVKNSYAVFCVTQQNNPIHSRKSDGDV